MRLVVPLRSRRHRMDKAIDAVEGLHSVRTGFWVFERESTSTTYDALMR